MKTKIVAIIANTVQAFRMRASDIAVENEIYIRVYDKESGAGRRFSRIELAYDWSDVRNAYELKEWLKTRLE